MLFPDIFYFIALYFIMKQFNLTQYFLKIILDIFEKKNKLNFVEFHDDFVLFAKLVLYAR